MDLRDRSACDVPVSVIPAIRTARLSLRMPRIEDADWLATWLGQTEIAAALTSIPHPFQRHHAVLWVTRRRKAPSARIIEADGEPVGAVSIDPDLAYWLVPGARGRGFALEAAAALTDWHMSRGADRLASGAVTGNMASLRLLATLGFRPGRVEPRRCEVRGVPAAVQTMHLSRGDWLDRRQLPYLQTPRLIMRPLQMTDAPRLAEIGSDPRVAPMIYWATVPWSEAAVLDFIDRFSWKDAPGFKLALCARGQLVGTVGYALLAEEPELSWFLDPAAWGQGLAREALSAFLPACFDAFGAPAIRAEIYDDNTASRALAEALGFRAIAAGSAPTHARLEPAPYTVYRLDRADSESQK